jgi:hypothetical protein
LEIAISCYKTETRESILDKGSKIRAYVDDVVIKRRRLQDVEEVFIALVIKTNKMGLEINGKRRQNFLHYHETLTMRKHM